MFIMILVYYVRLSPFILRYISLDMWGVVEIWHSYIPGVINIRGFPDKKPLPPPHPKPNILSLIYIFCVSIFQNVNIRDLPVILLSDIKLGEASRQKSQKWEKRSKRGGGSAQK